MIPQAVIFAQGFEDLIMIVVVVVFFLISAVGQLLSKARGAQKDEAARPAPRPVNRQQDQPPMPPDGGRAQAQGGRGAMEDEIADFLRRATQQRAKPAEQGPEMRRPGPAIEPDVIAEAEVLAEAEIVEDQPLGEGLRRHVGEYIEPERLGRDSSQLGDEVARTDSRVGDHLREVFDHDVSRLAKKPGESARPTTAGEEELAATPLTAADVRPVAAVGLAAMLGNVENLRQAIVINEILQRPIDRW